MYIQDITVSYHMSDYKHLILIMVDVWCNELNETIYETSPISSKLKAALQTSCNIQHCD